MSSLNQNKQKIYTHEGARAQHVSIKEQLRRSVMCCMLWENSFYESGVEIAQRIADLCKRLSAYEICTIAIEAREKMHVRHVPLWLVANVCKKEKRCNGAIADTLARIITRPDDMTEFLALYWKNGKCPLCRGVKEGLRRAFTRFDQYQLAKYSRKKEVKLKDVMFMAHPKPKDEEQAKAWKQLADDKLPTPDTWEVALSEKGADKKQVWTRLLAENRLGDLAFLRNLRNMQEANVSKDLIIDSMSRTFKKILPFHFIAAAKASPHLEPNLEQAMLVSLAFRDKLPGMTVVLVDVSGSMEWNSISAKSTLTCLDAACGLAMFAREISEDCAVYSFSNTLAPVPLRHGFALCDAIKSSQPHGGTALGAAIYALQQNMVAKVGVQNRLIVITDEQTITSLPASKFDNAYMINVSTSKNGVGYGNSYTHINGWSSGVIDYIASYETNLKKS